jgi:CheY-like chemotaxis protein
MALPLVLVVEDEALIRLHALSVLEDAGFPVLEAASAEAAIALLETRENIDIVFTDVQLGDGMDGLAFARAVRDRWPTVDLILTSGRMQVGPGSMPERGVFLNKPYQARELVESIRSFAS